LQNFAGGGESRLVRAAGTARGDEFEEKETIMPMIIYGGSRRLSRKGWLASECPRCQAVRAE
jgi:hypothetical protein